MGSEQQDSSSSSSLISGLREKHKQEVENLTLATQPLRTIKFFCLFIVWRLPRLILGTFGNGCWLVLLSVLAVAGVLWMTPGGPHEKHGEEILRYVRFGLWWLALGVASSIGLGSGLHTFVLYLGPHIALFTIKAMQCGRVDLKSAPYDTIQLKSGPSWLDKDCSEFGAPLSSSHDGSSIHLSSILPQVQLEAVLWGIGTALGELPPYFVSRAARISGGKLEAMQELDSPTKKDCGVIANHLQQITKWFFSHSQHLNFFTILVLASVPNPLFDLAGIMCGQFDIPFWKFFFATMIGKAIIKTHIQAVFIISVCNNQLLELVENRLIWLFSLVPGLAPILPDIINKLNNVKEKYMAPSAPTPDPSETKVKKWDLSFASVWNTVVWLILMNFCIKIVNATAQSFLEEEHEKELNTMINNISTSKATLSENGEAAN
ncbi:SNARE associated Golgi protein [Dillenia turbinata]|uniref:SNARE associated Golgi protein n=1 Tax=Dillenia turbinata TaxID=194707 RepID=A0AAN8UF22_9MAGN